MTILKITNGKVDITDPCYDRGAWCAVWDFKVKNGEYEITVDKTDEGRISMIRMMLEDGKPIRGEEIANVGVDAGLCGFFVDKPNFDSEGAPTWHSVCETIFGPQKNNDIYEIPSGVCSSSGWGDGMYPVIASYDIDDEVVGLTIVFIDDSDDEEDYEEEEDEEDE